MSEMMKYKLVPVELVQFLCGEAPLDGRWFGEDDPRSPTGAHVRRHWWRKHLRDAASASQSRAQDQRERIAKLEAALAEARKVIEPFAFRNVMIDGMPDYELVRGMTIPAEHIFAVRDWLSRNPVVQVISADAAMVAQINALPQRLRDYIHHLETDCDPQGTLRENFRLTEENKGLRAECDRLSAPASQMLTEELERIRRSMALLQQNAEGCAINHYKQDFDQQGMPGWLRDTQKDLETLTAILSRLPAAGGQANNRKEGEANPALPGRDNDRPRSDTVSRGAMSQDVAAGKPARIAADTRCRWEKALSAIPPVPAFRGQRAVLESAISGMKVVEIAIRSAASIPSSERERGLIEQVAKLLDKRGVGACERGMVDPSTGAFECRQLDKGECNCAEFDEVAERIRAMKGISPPPAGAE